MLRLTAAIVMAAAAGLNAPAVKAADCLNDWAAASQIVKSENLLTVEQLPSVAADQIQGQIVKTQLCRENGGYVYRLVVRDPKGQMKQVVIDARSPAKSQTKR